MQHNIYLYLLVMAAVTYAVRVLPLTLIRQQIQTGLFSLFFTMFLMSPWR